MTILTTKLQCTKQDYTQLAASQEGNNRCCTKANVLRLSFHCGLVVGQWGYIAPRPWLSLIEFVYPLIHTIPFYMQCLIRSPIPWVLLTVFDIPIIFHLAEDRFEL